MVSFIKLSALASKYTILFSNPFQLVNELIMAIAFVSLLLGWRKSLLTFSSALGLVHVGIPGRGQLLQRLYLSD